MMKTLKIFLHAPVCPVFMVTLFVSTCIAQSNLTSCLNHPNLMKSSPPDPNSLLLYNCSIRKRGSVPIQLSIQNNCTQCHATGPPAVGSFAGKIEEIAKTTHPCLLVDVENLTTFGFYLNDLNCSDYFLVHKTRSSSDEQAYELVTRVSFDIDPHQLPDLCKKCEKPNGSCGVGLRCICHPKQCMDQVISQGSSLRSTIYHVLFSVLCFLFVTGPFLLMNM